MSIYIYTILNISSSVLHKEQHQSILAQAMDSKKKKKNKNITGGKEAESSEEEQRIWKELEEEVERSLEEEIKDQIYHLALRLNRLYQHRMERTKVKPLISDHYVNISITMKGGTTVEIKETTSSNSSPKTTRVPKMAANNYKVRAARPPKVDWVKTLRSRYNHSSLKMAPGSSGVIDLR